MVGGPTRELVKDPESFFTASWVKLQRELQKSSICEIACGGGGYSTKHEGFFPPSLFFKKSLC